MFAANQSRQVTFLLIDATVPCDLVDAEVGMGAVRKSDRRRAATHLFHCHHVSQVTHLRAAVFLFHGNSMETERTHLRPQIARKFVLTVDRLGSGCNLAVAKLTHGFAQLLDLKSKIESERRIACSGHIRHGKIEGGELLNYGAPDANSSGRECSS